MTKSLKTNKKKKTIQILLIYITYYFIRLENSTPLFLYKLLMYYSIVVNVCVFEYDFSGVPFCIIMYKETDAKCKHVIILYMLPLPRVGTARQVSRTPFDILDLYSIDFQTYLFVS